MTPVLERCVTLGRAFGRLQMKDHVKLLRAFYAAARDGTPCTNGWNAAFVDEWLAVLRLPPFETELAVQPAGATCATCHAQPGAISSRRTVRTFPGGAVMRCDECNTRWLEHYPS